MESVGTANPALSALPRANAQWTEWRARLLVFVREFGGPAALDPEDSVQEIVERVIERAEQFDARHSFSTWVYRVARNYCIDARRKGLRRGALMRRHGAELAPEYDPRPGPAEEHELAEAADEVRSAISHLRTSDRQIAFLRYSADLPISEIAQVMSMPVGSVKYRLHVILKRLRRELAAHAGKEAR